MHAVYETFPMLLHETASTWRNQLDKRLKPMGLSQAKWRALLHLSRAKDPLTQTELANKLGIECPTLVNLLDRLAEADWIIRQDSPKDRRSKVVMLTDKAQETLIQITEAANQLRQEILTVISEESLIQCTAVLEQIKRRIENLS